MRPPEPGARAGAGALTNRVSRPGPPPVSIVVATHNRPAWLRLALDSALGQDYPDLEVLVLDDGSTDETPTLLADYAQRYPRERFRFASHENMGQARTLNRGYGLARGEILGYLSDDDILAPGGVAALAGTLIERPDAAAAYPAYRIIDGAGAILDTTLPLEYAPLTALSHHDTIIGPGALARRSALESAGGWNPSFHWIGDLIMWMGVGLSGPIVRVPKPLASWRKHADATTSECDVDRAKEHLRVFAHGLGLATPSGVSPAARAEALRNACVVGALFAGGAETTPGERFMVVDQDRAAISAWVSGQRPAGERFDAGLAEESAALLRQLGSLTLELGELRARSRAGPGERVAAGPQPAGEPGPGGGFERAIERLRRIGAMAGEDGSMGGEANEREFRLGLMEAALDCAADTDPESTRFLIFDRDRMVLVRKELKRLVRLGFGPEDGLSMPDAVGREIARRRADIARLAGASRRPSAD